MKRSLSLFIILCLLVLTGFAQGSVSAKAAAAKETVNKIGIRGIVKSINKGKDGTNFLVQGKVEKDTLYDYVNVHSDIHTTIYKDDLKRLYSLSDIKVGDTVEVDFAGPLEMSYPAFGTAKSIRIVTKPSTGKMTYAKTSAFLSLTEEQRTTVIDVKKATVEEFTAPSGFTVSYKGSIRSIGGKETVKVSFDATNSKILGPIVVYLDKSTKSVLGYGFRM